MPHHTHSGRIRVQRLATTGSQARLKEMRVLVHELHNPQPQEVVATHRALHAGALVLRSERSIPRAENAKYKYVTHHQLIANSAKQAVSVASDHVDDQAECGQAKPHAAGSDPQRLREKWKASDRNQSCRE